MWMKKKTITVRNDSMSKMKLLFSPVAEKQLLLVFKWTVSQAGLGF
jgi:hypothetical protein